MADYPIIAGQVKPIGTPVTDTRIVANSNNVVQGETLRIDPTDDTWRKAGASTLQEAEATHVALSAGVEGQPVTAARLQRGLILDMGLSAAVPAGDLVVQSVNPGRMAPSTDIVTGNFVTYLGTGIGNNQVLFNANASGVQKP